MSVRTPSFLSGFFLESELVVWRVPKDATVVSEKGSKVCPKIENDGEEEGKRKFYDSMSPFIELVTRDLRGFR